MVKEDLELTGVLEGFGNIRVKRCLTVAFLMLTPSYVNTPITTLLENQRNDKKKQYNSAVEKRRGTFTPFIASCDAILDVEAEHYLKRLSSYLSEKWEKSYSEVIGWVRARVQVCILRSVSLCLRGSRTKWLSSIIEDGSALPRLEVCWISLEYRLSILLSWKFDLVSSISKCLAS